MKEIGRESVSQRPCFAEITQVQTCSAVARREVSSTISQLTRLAESRLARGLQRRRARRDKLNVQLGAHWLRVHDWSTLTLGCCGQTWETGRERDRRRPCTQAARPRTCLSARPSTPLSAGTCLLRTTDPATSRSSVDRPPRAAALRLRATSSSRVSQCWRPHSPTHLCCYHSPTWRRARPLSITHARTHVGRS